MNEEEWKGVEVGTLRGSAATDDGAGFDLRWTVDDFMRRAQRIRFLLSPVFHFRSVEFSLTIIGTFVFDDVPYEPHVTMSSSPIPFSWKLSVERGDGTVLQCAEGVVEELRCGGIVLVHLRNFKRLLRPNGSLVVMMEFRGIPKDTATNPSLQRREVSRIGTVHGSADDGEGFVLRWTVDEFLLHTKKRYLLWSPFFCFRSVTLYLRLAKASGETYELEVYLTDGPPLTPFSWKFSVEKGNGTVLQCAEGVEKKMDVASFNLGSLRDVEWLLHTNGSLVLLFELRPIPEEETAAAAPSSPSLQHPASQYPHIWHLAAGCSVHERHLIVPNFRELAERKTLNVICSERFQFGSRLWQLRLSAHPGKDLEDHVLLSLEEVGGRKTSCPYSWKLWAENGGGVILQSSSGVCKDAKGARDLTLPLGRFLDSEGALRVACELRLPKETADASSQAESGVGTDVLARDLEQLLSSGDASDATIRVKGEKDFRVHRNILGARTPVFSSMFRHKMSENASGVVDIEDCEPDTFGHFLHYVYTGRVKDFRPGKAIPLYQVADKYQVEELKLECLEHIRDGLSVESFCPTLALALTYSEKELTQLATDFFVDHAKEITLTVGWQRFVCENPIQANELIVKMLQNTEEKTTSSKNLNM